MYIYSESTSRLPCSRGIGTCQEYIVAQGCGRDKITPPVRMAVNVLLLVAVVVLCIAIVAIWSFIILYGAKLNKLFHFSK